MASHISAPRLHRVLPRLNPNPAAGLSRAEAAERLANGYANESTEAPERSTARIVADNLFTYFNLIFAVLAVCVITTGSYRDLTFLPVVFINIIIGTVQELRSRKKLRALTFMAAPKAVVVRDGEELTIPGTEAVLDDIAIFTSGVQIYADAIVVSGEIRVNEALVTGESDEIAKLPGDTLLSGSFVVNGECRARLDRVGREAFVAKLTSEAKKADKKMRSQMMHALTKLVKILGILIVPFGLIMLYQQLFVLNMSYEDSMITTVAALIGMIPEGLYLLVSVALTVSVMRLAKRRTLVQEMRCIETLARVDVLCVDKTGTITEPEMNVRELVLLCPDRFTEDDTEQILADYLVGASNENETLAALARRFTKAARQGVSGRLNFSSTAKFAGAELADGTAFLVGAPEKLVAPNSPHRQAIEHYSAEGYRVLLLAMYDGDVATAPQGLMSEPFPIALILLTNKIRDAAPETFRFFAEQGVSVRVISGDNPTTVARIAADAGIPDAERCIDASTLKTERQIRRAAAEYIVFGRVTPDVKRRLIRALRAEGHTVAMTGDGVNDVLALKDADCAIAMASGSDIACHISQLVLLDSDFSALTAVVTEGRRVINNIERSASLFLVKNIFSVTVTLLALIFTLTYPITPSQLSLFNVMFIGIPSFVLALEPNHERVRGSFLTNVILNSLPAGLTNLIAIAVLMFFGDNFGVPSDELSTLATLVIAFVGLLMLFKISQPLNRLRRALLIAMTVGFVGGSLLLHDLFNMSALSGRAIIVTIIICAATAPLMFALSLVSRAVRSRFADNSTKLHRRNRIKV